MLHTWGSALTHHPHVHVIVPGGGLSPDGSRWIACKPGFFLPVRVLSRLFRRLFLEGLPALKQAGQLAFFGDLAPLADKDAFDAALAPLRRSEWVVYAKRPFAGPRAVLAYLSRYTHRVAISSPRLIAPSLPGFRTPAPLNSPVDKGPPSETLQLTGHSGWGRRRRSWGKAVICEERLARRGLLDADVPSCQKLRKRPNLPRAGFGVSK